MTILQDEAEPKPSPPPRHRRARMVDLATAASNAEYIDCNYGGVLIVFDRLFGTLRVERAGEPVRYGLARPLGSTNPLRIAFGEWRRLFGDMRAAGSLCGALQTAVGRP